MPELLGFVPGKRAISEAVRAVAVERHGIVTREQLLVAGASSSAIGRALCSGGLHRMYRGVYSAVAPGLLTEEGHLVAALFAAGEGALLRRGGAAWGRRHLPPPPPGVPPR